MLKEEFLSKLENHNIEFSPMINEAIDHAENSHGHVKRIDGSSYMEQHIYPVTSDIIDFFDYIGVKCPEDIIVAALLHDVLEDDKTIKHKDFIKRFGRKIYSIVHALSKKSVLEEKTYETVMAMNKDIWSNIKNKSMFCILIKLADRANNLESDIKVKHIVPERVKIDIETVENEYLSYAKNFNKYYYEKFLNILEQLKS